MRVVINTRHGGFAVSRIGRELLRVNSKYPENEDFEYAEDAHQFIYRTDPILILSVMCMGDLIGATFSNLKIVDIPDNIDWGIAEYDGMEHIYEEHRTWS